MILVDGRRIMVSGPLDDDTANELCGALVALDRESFGPVELLLNGSGGSVDGCAAVLDIFAVLRAPLEATVRGRADGPVGIVLVCAPGVRRVSPNATVSLRVDRSASSALGSIEQAADLLKTRLDHLAGAIADRIGADVAFIERELKSGVVRDAEDAKQANFVDEIVEAG